MDKDLKGEKIKEKKQRVPAFKTRGTNEGQRGKQRDSTKSRNTG